MADGLTMVPTTWDGVNQFIAKLDVGVRATVAAALYEHMLGVMERAKNLCPYEEGDLAGSGRVNKATVNSEGVHITLDFGVEPPIPYAVDQHENLSYHHPGGKHAKFLEIALMEWANSDGPQRVIDDVETYLGRDIF